MKTFFFGLQLIFGRKNTPILGKHLFFFHLFLVFVVINRVWLLTDESGSDPDLKIEKVADPDFFLLDPDLFQIFKFVEPTTPDLNHALQLSEQLNFVVREPVPGNSSTVCVANNMIKSLIQN